MESPNYFSTAHSMTTCGDGLAFETFAFGFMATGLRIINTCGPRLFFNLQGEASCGNDYVSCGAELVLNPLPPFGGLSLKTTSTSTTGGVPVARPIVGISAWGSA